MSTSRGNEYASYHSRVVELGSEKEALPTRRLHQSMGERAFHYWQARHNELNDAQARLQSNEALVLAFS